MKSVLLRETLLIIGFSAVVYGVFLIYIPASLIIGGSGLIWFALPKIRQGKGK